MLFPGNFYPSLRPSKSRRIVHYLGTVQSLANFVGAKIKAENFAKEYTFNDF